MILPVATIVTEKTLSEFLLMRKSLEQYHDCVWYISCDDYVMEYDFGDMKRYCFDFIESDDADHNVKDEQKRDRWMKVMMSKFSICKEALKEEEFVLFLDCDMLFVGPIEDRILSLTNKVDAVVCEHMTNNPGVEAKHGLLNAGMFATNSLEFINSWEALSKDYKKYGFYFEQQPLEFIQRNFVTLHLPINYNLGWWRFNNENTRHRLSQLKVEDNKIYFGNKRVVNFHLHMLRDLETANFGKFLSDRIIELMKESNDESYNKILTEYDALSK